MDSALFENWKDYVMFSEDGPEPYVLMESKSFKVVLVGLGARVAGSHSGHGHSHGESDS